MRTFSFGGGVQSVAVLVLAAQSKVQYDHFLFANVGNDSENPDTLTYFEQVAKPYASAHGIDLVELHRVKRNGEAVTLYEHVMAANRTIDIPVRMSNGAPGNRNCTGQFKIKHIAKWLKEHGATTERPAVTGLGISTDESQRARKESGIAWQVLEYPLIQLGLSRRDCVQLIEQAGLPVPPKSACFFCPYKRKGEWQEMRRTKPDLFDKAVVMEQQINEKRASFGKDAVYLHPSLYPLEQVVGIQHTLFEDEECNSGYCFI
jgi:hypothetical protein